MATILFIIILVYSVIIHEIAHAYMAEKLGDPTPRLSGRLTLNPIPHIDLFGSVLLPAILILLHSPFLVGWAKPVPFNPQYIRNKKWGPALVAIAGPLANIFVAVAFAILIRIFPFPYLLREIFSGIIVTNIALAIFNLIPIPPLDGHHILYSLLANRADEFKRFYNKYALFFLLIFIVYGWKFISPLIVQLSNILIPS